MKISMASDHGGFALKEHIRAYLTNQGHTVIDVGTHSLDSCDYADFAYPAAKLLADGEVDRAVLVCSTGIGISIAANKVKGIRCALCSEPYSAEMTRRHNDANCLAMGGLMVGDMMAERIVDTFLNTEFEGGRHSRRIGKIADIEEKERQ